MAFYYAPTMEKQKTDAEKIAEVEEALDPPLPWYTYVYPIGSQGTVYSYGTPQKTIAVYTTTPKPVPHAKIAKNKKRYEPSKRDQFKWQNSQTNRKLSRLRSR